MNIDTLLSLNNACMVYPTLAFYSQPTYFVIFKDFLVHSKRLDNVFLSLCQSLLIDVFTPFTFSVITNVKFKPSILFSALYLFYILFPCFL